ncbi:predicted protein [Plenodomus lingam JN3]|uniref:Predicted protein n=1 Tax=Leptosphaeria maculans (strain JN3 / isolate v23.1.3 / race Av1-4-5-6-7-8) TaxID=985895 RepID=E4ZLG8_LEPMJ|nr:predicted protein [Plenodomus lingam JN3]CBX92327.1 predicted protein [Plenodomus lingam JN3]
MSTGALLSRALVSSNESGRLEHTLRKANFTRRLRWSHGKADCPLTFIGIQLLPLGCPLAFIGIQLLSL